MSSKYRQLVFVATYAKTNEGIKYLLLKRKLHWKGWEFPKGGVDKLETTRKAIKRELKEETGLEPLRGKNRIKKFSIKGKFNFDKPYKDMPKFMGQKWHL